ncbi:MAG: hypothetical protein JKY37_25305, partial [Nannocystaceae bacterium]|nr:hypothetical protein [Nannocystaceae bacterium]
MSLVCCLRDAVHLGSHSRVAVIVAAAGLAACGKPRDADTSFGGSLDGAPAGSDTASVTSSGAPGSSTGAMADDTSPGSSGAEGDIKLDVAPVDIPAPAQDYCNFVDILFVIDNSLSMDEYQTQLALAWPTFVDEMWANLPEGTDLHVGMTTTSFFDGSCSEAVFNCETTASDSSIAAHYTTPDVGSTGVNGEQGRLFEWDGRRYFEATVGDDAGDLKLWFSQAAVAAG